MAPEATRDSRLIQAPSPERLRRYWDKHAKGYDREMAFFEPVLFADGRDWACSHASGDVLEVAIGTGRNLPFYRPDIRLTGVEFSPAMLGIARQRASALGRQVDLRLGDAQALDLPDSVFDTVLCTLSLCGIPDERRAIAEMKRVLRPGGRLVLVDHVAGSPAWVRAIQWLLELITIPLGGEHFRRRPILAVHAAGFVVETSQRSKLGIVERVLARKPAQTTDK
jgi:ubiquinone/menaquinone biosynthesis C-methylase UbiE